MNKNRDLLNSSLLTQSFDADLSREDQLEDAQRIARQYSRLENSISILSDMNAGISYIYYSKFAQELGFSAEEAVINSIWEDELLRMINPDDLQRKYRIELQFFSLLKTIPKEERVNYEVITKLSAQLANGETIQLQHRLLYINSTVQSCVWLALCLYKKIHSHPIFNTPEAVIINKSTGEVIDCNQLWFKDLLSTREKEILNLMKHGYRSKEISGKLSLSVHTVNRHRQNIFHKLNVNNVMEACRIASGAGLL